MTTSDTFTTFDFSFNSQEPNGTMNTAGFQLVTRGSMTDAMAFALVDAFTGLGWPSGTTVSATVTKDTVTDVSFTTNLTTPPTFT
ncbi:hypothetical protein [Streptacidiphilus albus]|uniref:hypothetical protein n=1 Tax=Streptacidiphilus albus TaxID=105425 RepID=UPI00054C7823|nr:hypothetical protein [Streptacidiphilus albus]